MELNITFGWHLDGPSYPEDAAVGRLTVGPIGMLNQLCLRLGLVARLPAQSIRIAEFMSRLGRCDDGAQFYSRSFKTDSWGTAKALLSLRDQLQGSGWDVAAALEWPGLPERLAVLSRLCRLETAGETDDPSASATDSNLVCLTDMIGPVLERLERLERIAIDSVTLVDEEAHLPPVWRRLFAVLRTKQVEVKNASHNNNAVQETCKTDLQKLSSLVRSNCREELSGDGTLVVLEADDEMQAAHCLAHWLRETVVDGRSTDSPSGTRTGNAGNGALPGDRRGDAMHRPLPDLGNIVIIRGSSTSLIDQCLSNLFLPILGGGDKSTLRGYMQVLPMALELLWKPFDPMAMIEFLMLPHGPVSPSVARRFINALKQQPGIGGGAWHEAWDRTRRSILDRLRQELTSDEEDDDLPKQGNLLDGLRETAGQSAQNQDTVPLSSDSPPPPKESIEELLELRLSSLRAWLEPAELYDSQEGMPASVVVSLCDRVRRHAHMRANTVTDRLTADQLIVFVKTALCADNLAATVNASGLEKIARSQLLRMIESAMGDGYSTDVAEASTWTPVDHPGQIVGPAGTVIWWGFADYETHAITNPWSAEETAFLASLGVELDYPQLAVVREAKSWSRLLDLSIDRLLLVKPRTVAGKAVAAHPFYHEVSAALESTSHSVRSNIVKQAHTIYTQPGTELFGREITSKAVTLQPPPGKRPIWRITPRTIRTRVESATSLERLLGCPMSWLLKYKANLRFGNLLSVTSGEQLSGVLAHAVLAAVFSATDWKNWKEHDVETRTESLFDELCPKIAAPLLLPGSSLERQKLKKAICDAAGNLSMLIKQAGFSTVVLEAQKDATVDDISLTGRPDMILLHPDNEDYVVDLKWSRRASYRRREISEGRAIQLALYASLLKKETGNKTSGGYFMISQRQMFSTSREPFPDHTYVEGPALESTFNSLVSNCKQHLMHLDDGTVYATGVVVDPIPQTEGLDGAGMDIMLDDEPELPAAKIPNITLALEPPCKICEFGRLCGKKEFDT